MPLLRRWRTPLRKTWRQSVLSGRQQAAEATAAAAAADAEAAAQAAAAPLERQPSGAAAMAANPQLLEWLSAGKVPAEMLPTVAEKIGSIWGISTKEQARPIGVRDP